MRKTIAVAAATGALLLGGAGVANAETQAVGPAQTTTLAADDYGNNTDNSGMWGLAGLLGLLGLLGLRKQHDNRDNRAGITSGVNRGHTPPAANARAAGGATSSGMPAGPTSGTSMGTSGSSATYPTTPQSHPGNTPPTS